jgi:hypothetical protein
MGQSRYPVLRRRLAEALVCAAEHHEAGRCAFIDEDCKALESALHHAADARYQKLFWAPNFWAGWIFAQGTGWVEHLQFPRDPWPVMARSIAADLVNDREISDPRVRFEFDLTTTLQLPQEYLKDPWAYFHTSDRWSPTMPIQARRHLRLAGRVPGLLSVHRAPVAWHPFPDTWSRPASPPLAPPNTPSTSRIEGACR